MNELAALQNLDSVIMGWGLGAIVFGLIGFAAFRYGRKNERPATKWLGVALMIYPYAVSSTVLLYAVGIALCAGAWYTRE